MIHNQRFPKQRRPSIRVAVIIPGLGAGGAERCFVTLAKHFIGVRVESIIVRKGKGADRQLAAEARSVSGCYLHLSHDENDFRKTIGSRVYGDHVDAVLTWGLADLRDLISALNAPVIDICHTSAEWKTLTPVMAGTAEGANYLVAVSEAARDSYPEEYRSQVRIIPNGIEPSRCSPRMGRDHVRRSWGIAPDQMVALYVGRFADEKRPISLIDSLPDGWLLVAAGPDSDKKTEFAVAAQARAPGRTAFVPFSTNVGDLMAMADCLVMPSLTEAHPLTMFEAMFAELPIVCCEFKFLDESPEGLPIKWRDLVEPIPVNFDRADLSSAMNRAADARSFERTLNAHRIVCRNYLADQMAARYERMIFDSVREWLSYSIDPPLIYNGEASR